MKRLVWLSLIVVVLAGCKKKAATVPTTAPTLTATEVTSGNTNYEAGAGALQNVRNAAMRTITLAEMQQLGVFIEDQYLIDGKMPRLDVIRATLQKNSPNTLKMIDDKKIILCWTAQHEGLWAYEVDADTKGGIGLVTGQARRCEADEIRRLLGR
jgi:hypothetical protein